MCTQVWLVLRTLQTAPDTASFLELTKELTPFILHSRHLSLPSPAYHRHYTIALQLVLSQDSILSKDDTAGLCALLLFIKTAAARPSFYRHLLYALKVLVCVNMSSDSMSAVYECVNRGLRGVLQSGEYSMQALRQDVDVVCVLMLLHMHFPDEHDDLYAMMVRHMAQHPHLHE